MLDNGGSLLTIAIVGTDHDENGRGKEMNDLSKLEPTWEDMLIDIRQGESREAMRGGDRTDYVIVRELTKEAAGMRVGT